MSMVLDGASPRSRSTDPTTSVDAGRGVDLCGSQSTVLALLRAHRHGMTQEEVADALPGLSPSRARSAVSELVERGLVAPTGATRPTKYGRKAQIFKAV